MEIIAATGPRPHKLGNEYEGVGPYSDYARIQLQEIIWRYQPTQLITGMALGIDTIWAELAIANNIPFIASIPFIGQDAIWPTKSKLKYAHIINHPLCTRVFVCEPGYATWKLLKRNEWMVNNCTMLAAVWDGTSGGTKHCVDYAISKLKYIERIIPRQLKPIIIPHLKM